VIRSWWFVLIAAGLVAPVAGQCSKGLLAEDIPAHVDGTKALDLARNALLNREWTVTGGDARSVTAKIISQNMESQIVVTVAGGQIRYDERTVSLDAMRHGQTPDIQIPARWINALRADIQDQVRSLRAAEAPAAALKRAPADRMAELQRLRDAGHITAEEFERKRAEILKDL